MHTSGNTLLVLLFALTLVACEAKPSTDQAPDEKATPPIDCEAVCKDVSDPLAFDRCRVTDRIVLCYWQSAGTQTFSSQVTLDAGGNPEVIGHDRDSDGTPDAIITYKRRDGLVTEVTSDDNADGKADARTTYKHNAHGWLEETRVDEPLHGKPELVFRYDYDAEGNLSRVREEMGGVKRVCSVQAPCQTPFEGCERICDVVGEKPPAQ